MACAESLRVQAYFDGELDALAAVDVERHLEGCADCRALRADLERLRAAIRTDLTPQLRPQLRARVALALDAEDGPARAPARALKRASWGGRSFWMGAFSGLAGSAVAASLWFLLLSPTLGSALLDDVVSAHVRSLMPAHLIDVLPARGQHDHGYIGHLADGLQDFEAVLEGHVDVQQDDVRLLVEEAVQADLAIGRGKYVGILPLQLDANLQRVAQARVVIDYQYLHGITSQTPR